MADPLPRVETEEAVPLTAKHDAASFDESPEERDQRRRERADKARPNVSMTPGQAETLAEDQAAAHTARENTALIALQDAVMMCCAVGVDYYDDVLSNVEQSWGFMEGELAVRDAD